MYYYLAVLKSLESFCESPSDIIRLRQRWLEALLDGRIMNKR